MRELLYQDRSAHRHLDLLQRRVLCTTFPIVRLIMISTVVFRYSLHFFEMIALVLPNMTTVVLVGSTKLHTLEIWLADKKLV